MISPPCFRRRPGSRPRRRSLLGLLGLGSRLGGVRVGLGDAGGDFLGARQRGDLVDRGFLDQAGGRLFMRDRGWPALSRPAG